MKNIILILIGLLFFLISCTKTSIEPIAKQTGTPTVQVSGSSNASPKHTVFRIDNNYYYIADWNAIPKQLFLNPSFDSKIKVSPSGKYLLEYNSDYIKVYSLLSNKYIDEITLFNSPFIDFHPNSDDFIYTTSIELREYNFPTLGEEIIYNLGTFFSEYYSIYYTSQGDICFQNYNANTGRYEFRTASKVLITTNYEATITPSYDSKYFKYLFNGTVTYYTLPLSVNNVVSSAPSDFYLIDPNGYSFKGQIDNTMYYTVSGSSKKYLYIKPLSFGDIDEVYWNDLN